MPEQDLSFLTEAEGMKEFPKLEKKFLMIPGAEILEQIKYGFLDDQPWRLKVLLFI